jgi:hypothetical protein
VSNAFSNCGSDRCWPRWFQIPCAFAPYFDERDELAISPLRHHP